MKNLLLLTALAAAVIICLATTMLPVAVDAVLNVVAYKPDVPLSHCMTFGPGNSYQFEWEIDTAARQLLQMRFTANVQRGYSSFGFTHLNDMQLVSGYPTESLPCARRIWDTVTAYDRTGAAYESYPETPANYVTANISHVSHYVMRNLSTTAKRMLDSGGSLSTNITLLWGMGLESMFGPRDGTGDIEACYGLSMADTFEMAQMTITFTDSYYQKVNGTFCKPYANATVPFRNQAPLKAPPAELLDAELNQNTRMAGLLVGGDMLVTSGQAAPDYKTPPGYVEAGENYANVCQNSLSALKMRWNGFTEAVGGVQKYQVTAGTAAQPSLYLDRVSASTNLAYEFTGLQMTKNETLYVKLDAVNFAGLERTVALPPMRILNGARPVFGKVVDGTAVETADGTVPIQFIRSTDRLAAHWRDYMVQDYSSIDGNTSVATDNGYEYAVGIAGNVSDSFLPWTAVGTFGTERVLTGLTLTHGKKYFFSIRTTNCAGVQVMAYSSGVTVDVSSPARGRVWFSNRTGYNNPVLHRSNPLAVSWEGFVDHTSGISEYHYAIGKTPKPLDDASNLGMIVNWTSTGTTTRVTGKPWQIYMLPMAIQSLVPIGTILHAYVKATDRAGNYVIGYSNATTVVSN